MTRTSDLQGEIGPHPLKLLLLEDPEQLDLDSRREISNLIEEDGPAIGLLKSADPPLDRSCKGAFLMAEEFTFKKGLRNGRAVHLDQGFCERGLA